MKYNEKKEEFRNIRHLRMRSVTIILVLLIVLAGVICWPYHKNGASVQAAPIAEHDLTLEDNGIFGFSVADFEEPILGTSARQGLFIVREQESYVNTRVTDTGLFNWGIFNKEQAVTIYGKGQYTIDLLGITAEDISLNEDTYELTIRIPHASLHQTTFEPSKTEIGDSSNGWLAFGSIKLTQEEQKAFEEEAVSTLETELSRPECLEEADRFAKLSAYEIYQPVVKAVSPAYSVKIEFK